MNALYGSEKVHSILIISFTQLSNGKPRVQSSGRDIEAERV